MNSTHSHETLEQANLLEKYLTRLKENRFQHINDLPPHRITTADANYQLYKCRTNRWDRINSDLEAILWFVPHLSPLTMMHIDAFQTYIKTIDFTVFRIQEEIDQADAFLDIIIELLETQYTSKTGKKAIPYQPLKDLVEKM